MELLKTLYNTTGLSMLTWQQFIMIIIALPQAIILINGINGESIVYVIKYMVIYIIKEKVYLYEKQIIN